MAPLRALRSPLVPRLRFVTRLLRCLNNRRVHHVGSTIEEIGGADRDRTDDPLLAKQVLSQLSYSPIRFGIED